MLSLSLCANLLAMVEEDAPAGDSKAAVTRFPFAGAGQAPTPSHSPVVGPGRPAAEPSTPTRSWAKRKRSRPASVPLKMALPDLPLPLAMMSAVPLPVPVATPSGVTLATFGSLDAHTMGGTEAPTTGSSRVFAE